MAVAVWHSDDGDVFCAVGNMALCVVVGLRCSFSVVAVGVQ